MKRGYNRNALLGAVLALAMAGAVSANNINTGGQLGVGRCLSSKTLGFTGLNVGGGFLYQSDWHYLDDLTGYDEERGQLHMLSGNVFANYGLLSFWDLGVMLPLYYDVTGWERTYAGVGDLEITTKLALPIHKDKQFFTQAVYGKVICPTGSDDRGYFPRHAYYSTTGNAPFTSTHWLFGIGAAWSLDFRNVRGKLPLEMHGNIGGVLTKDKDESVITGAFAIEYFPWKFLSFFVEINGEARVDYYTDYWSLTSFKQDPVYIMPGLRLTHPKGFWLTLAGDIGISSQRSAYHTHWDDHGVTYNTTPTPRYGVQINAGWKHQFKKPNPDRDGDGIPDHLDGCPNEPEDKDGFQDDDGCPDLDNDADGVMDSHDKCPNESATCSGCPEFDRDKDGVPDSLDKCVDEPEDMDGFQDNDGCPDLDNDQDGIPDKDDKCLNEAEDKDGFQDNDGCPDLDNDQDGVLDANDKCPNVKGPGDNDGCPKTKEIPRNGLILKGVTFASGKAVLMRNSSTILDMVAESLIEWTEVRIEVQGHTDSQGNAATNLKLSQARAEAVVKYLADKGVASYRLTAVGYGPNVPIGNNATASGREQNRRVELKRTD